MLPITTCMTNNSIPQTAAAMASIIAMAAAYEARKVEVMLSGTILTFPVSDGGVTLQLVFEAAKMAAFQKDTCDFPLFWTGVCAVAIVVENAAIGYWNAFVANPLTAPAVPVAMAATFGNKAMEEQMAALILATYIAEVIKKYASSGDPAAVANIAAAVVALPGAMLFSKAWAQFLCQLYI